MAELKFSNTTIQICNSTASLITSNANSSFFHFDDGVITDYRFIPWNGISNYTYPSPHVTKQDVLKIVLDELKANADFKTELKKLLLDDTVAPEEKLAIQTKKEEFDILRLTRDMVSK